MIADQSFDLRNTVEVRKEQNMKRLLTRLTTLIVMTLTGWMIYADTPASAAQDCATAVYDKWNTCDNGYSNTAQQYAIRVSYCEQNAPATCPPAAEPGCAALPPSEYATCCLAASRAACEATVSANYDNRGSAYFTCLGIGEGNLGNCIEQIDICPAAHDRAAMCNLIYEESEDWDARNTCLANSGINQCV